MRPVVAMVCCPPSWEPSSGLRRGETPRSETHVPAVVGSIPAQSVFCPGHRGNRFPRLLRRTPPSGRGGPMGFVEGETVPVPAGWETGPDRANMEKPRNRGKRRDRSRNKEER